jgi:hypothetical protein
MKSSPTSRRFPGRLALPAAALFLAVAPLHAAPLHLDFHHEIAGQPLLVDSLRYENSKGETFSVTRLDWLATDISLTTSSGDTLVIPDSAVFVPTRGTTFTLPDLPAEKITAITFYIGPDRTTNPASASRPPTKPPSSPTENALRSRPASIERVLHLRPE